MCAEIIALSIDWREREIERSRLAWRRVMLCRNGPVVAEA